MSPRITVLSTLLALALGSGTALAQELPDGAVRIVAQALAEAVTARDADAASTLCSVPANIDGEVVATAEALRNRWRRTLDRDDLRGLVLERVEVLTLEAAVARYGTPPRRLGELDPESVVAVITWNRAQLVAVLAERSGRWAVIAVTD